MKHNRSSLNATKEDSQERDVDEISCHGYHQQIMASHSSEQPSIQMSNSFPNSSSGHPYHSHMLPIPIPVCVLPVGSDVGQNSHHDEASNPKQQLLSAHPHPHYHPQYFYPHHYYPHAPPPPHGYPIYCHHPPPPPSHLYQYGVPIVSNGDMTTTQSEEKQNPKEIEITRNSSFKSKQSDDTDEKTRKYEIRQKEADLRLKIKHIKSKDDEEKTEAEVELYKTYELRRARKNERSRKRTKEINEEMERIQSIPEHDRTSGEKKWLERKLIAKKRKNESDRHRRKRIKSLRSLSPSRFSPQHCIDPSSTYSTLESRSESIIEHVDSTNSGTLKTDENEEALCPEMLMHFVRSFENPDSPHKLIDARPATTTNASSPQISEQYKLETPRISQQYKGGELFDVHVFSPELTSPVRLPTIHESSRSSIFRLKPKETNSLK